MKTLSLRVPAMGSAVVLAALAAAATPALAAPIGDGTSNTIQVAVASAALDQAHHRIVITGAPSGLVPGRHLAAARIVTPQSSWVFSDIMIESVVGTTSSLSLNYAKLEFQY